MNKESREVSRIKTTEETGLWNAMLSWFLDWNKNSSMYYILNNIILSMSNFSGVIMMTVM